MRFEEGQTVQIYDSGGYANTWKIKQGQDGEPFRHRVMKSGKISTEGVRVKITDRFKA